MTNGLDADGFDALVDGVLAAPMKSREDLLRDAYAYSTGNPSADALRRQSLVAMARQDPALTETIAALEADDRTRMDLHLNGALESRHETSARLLGQFLVRLNEAVKAIARSTSGLPRLLGDLSIVAPAPGSVRIVLLEDAFRASTPERQHSRDAWADGIQRLAQTFGQAQNDDEALGGALLELDLVAREAVRLLAQTMEEAEWSVEGALVGRDGHTTSLALSALGVSRLRRVATMRDGQVTTRTLIGVVNSWDWPTASMKLKPSGGGRRLKAYVPGALRTRVASLNTTPDRQVEVQFQEVLTVSATGHARVARTLLDAHDLSDLFEE